MSQGTDALKAAFRDYVTEGVPATGANEPDKAEVRAAADQIALDIAAASLGDLGEAVALLQPLVDDAEAAATAAAASAALFDATFETASTRTGTADQYNTRLGYGTHLDDTELGIGNVIGGFDLNVRASATAATYYLKVYERPKDAADLLTAAPGAGASDVLVSTFTATLAELGVLTTGAEHGISPRFDADQFFTVRDGYTYGIDQGFLSAASAHVLSGNESIAGTFTNPGALWFRIDQTTWGKSNAVSLAISSLKAITAIKRDPYFERVSDDVDTMPDLAFGLGDISQSVSGSQSTALNGAAFLTDSAGNRIGLSVPNGSTGQNSALYADWPVDGAGNEGQTIRFELNYDVSATFTRTLFMQLSVRTGPSTYVNRTAGVFSTPSAGKRLWVIEYTLQGDELALRPAIVLTSTGATTGTETILRTSFKAKWQTPASGYTVAEVNLAAREDMLLGQAATILTSPFAETIVVGTGGAFATLSAALDAITDSSVTKQYKIALLGSATLGSPEKHVPPWVSIIAYDRADVLMEYANANDASAATITNTSTLWLDRDGVVIEGGRWRITNGRYVFHWESNGAYRGATQRAIGVDLEHMGNDAAVNNTWAVGSQYGIGGGLSWGQKALFIDSIARGPGGGLSFHSPNLGGVGYDPFLVDVEGCIIGSKAIVASGTYAGEPYPDLTAKPIALGPGRFRLRGNSFENDLIAYADGEWPGGNPGAGINTAQIEVAGFGNTPFTFSNRIQFGSAAGAAYQPRLTGTA